MSQLRRFVVLGCSGSGKSTLSRQLAQLTGLPVLELDRFFHLQNWTHPTVDEFRRSVFLAAQKAEESAGGWIVDGSYDKKVGFQLQSQADTIVWLDLPRWKVMYQIISRTLWRVTTRAELWNGNRESWSNLLKWDPEENVIRWSWGMHPQVKQRFLERSTSGDWSHARVVRIRNGRERNRFLRDVNEK